MSTVVDQVACIDLEGVLMPEIWPFLARQTGIEAFRETTREVSNYPALMSKRIAALRKHGLKLKVVQAIVAGLDPFPESADFLKVMSQHYSIRIVSDCFYELANTALHLLGDPIALCHNLVVDVEGFIVSCDFAPRLGKEDVVAALLDTGAKVIAVGDAFNDLAMLKRATRGFLLRPSDQTRAAASSMCIVERLEEITDMLLISHSGDAVPTLPSGGFEAFP